MKKTGYCYLIKANAIPNLYKIGETTGVNVRLKQLRSQYPDLDLVLFLSISTRNCERLEGYFQDLFFQERLPTMNRALQDWFILEAEQVEHIKYVASINVEPGKDVLEYLDLITPSWRRIAYQRIQRRVIKRTNINRLPINVIFKESTR